LQRLQRRHSSAFPGFQRLRTFSEFGNLPQREMALPKNGLTCPHGGSQETSGTLLPKQIEVIKLSRFGRWWM
jgi:hypothetical protein